MIEVRVGLVVAALAAAVGVAAAQDDLPAAAPASVERGRAVYEESCAPCHGFRGDGHGSAARWLDPRPRDFTRGLYKLRSTASGHLPTDEDLLRVIDVGVPGTSMPGWRDELSESDRRAVVAYVKTFAPRFTRARKPPEPRELPAPPEDLASLRAEGAALYQLMKCWDCHGREGRGDGPAVKTTRDDWNRRIDPADLTRRPLRWGQDAPAIYEILDTGMNGTPMPSYYDAALTGREGFEDLSAITTHYGKGVAPVLQKWVAQMPTQARIDEMSEPDRIALAQRRLWALAAYVMSLRKPRCWTDWLFEDQPGRYAEP